MVDQGSGQTRIDPNNPLLQAFMNNPQTQSSGLSSVFAQLLNAYAQQRQGQNAISDNIGADLKSELKQEYGGTYGS